MTRSDGVIVAQAGLVSSLTGAPLYWQVFVRVGQAWQRTRLTHRKTRFEVIDIITAMYEPERRKTPPTVLPPPSVIAQRMAKSLYGTESPTSEPKFSSPVNTCFGSLSVR